VTHLRQLMLDELQRRNTLRTLCGLTSMRLRTSPVFRRPPEQLGPDHVRGYQVHLFRDRKLSRAPSKDGQQRCDFCS